MGTIVTIKSIVSTNKTSSREIRFLGAVCVAVLFAAGVVALVFIVDLPAVQ